MAEINRPAEANRNLDESRLMKRMYLLHKISAYLDIIIQRLGNFDLFIFEYFLNY